MAGEGLRKELEKLVEDVVAYIKVFDEESGVGLRWLEKGRFYEELESAHPKHIELNVDNP